MRISGKFLFLCILSLGGCSGGPPLPPAEPVRAPAPEAPAAVPPPQAEKAVPPSAPREQVVHQALALVGVPYRRGGVSPAGFDCSGLVMHVYREALGISLPRNTRAQSETGQVVTTADLAPGDLVFYNTRNRKYSHVGLYLGDGRFVHAPKPGAAVRVESMRSTYWSKRYDGARRISVPSVAAETLPSAH